MEAEPHSKSPRPPCPPYYFGAAKRVDVSDERRAVLGGARVAPRRLGRHASDAWHGCARSWSECLGVWVRAGVQRGRVGCKTRNVAVRGRGLCTLACSAVQQRWGTPHPAAWRLPPSPEGKVMGANVWLVHTNIGVHHCHKIKKPARAAAKRPRKANAFTHERAYTLRRSDGQRQRCHESLSRTAAHAPAGSQCHQIKKPAPRVAERHHGATGLLLQALGPAEPPPHP